MEVISKEAALALLREHKRRLLAGRGGCVMCALANGGAGSMLIAENAHAVAVLDRFACKLGHLMVVGKRHVERATELDFPIYVDLQRLVFDATRVIEAHFKPARVFTATLGAAVELPQTYSHYHVHIIPVYDTDERARPARVLSWSEGVVVYDDLEAERICRELREVWPGRAPVHAQCAE